MRKAILLSVILVTLIFCSACFSMSGDHELSIRGVASSSGDIGFEVDGKNYCVQVDTGENAEQIGNRLISLMKDEGLEINCSIYDGEEYHFVLRNTRGQPKGITSTAGMGTGVTGPLQDDRMLIVESTIPRFYTNLNNYYQDGVLQYTTDNFTEEALDTLTNMSLNKEQIIVNSIGEPQIDCFQATICLNITISTGSEQKNKDICLALNRSLFNGIWQIDSGDIR